MCAENSRVRTGAVVFLTEMTAIVSKAMLDALIDPKFQAELPEELRAPIKRKVAKTALQGDYGQITLGSSANAVREAAKRLKAKPRVSKKLAATLPELSRIPGY
jgi:hypothetical protein